MLFAPASIGRLVVKIGSALLVDPDGSVRRDWLAGIAADIAARCGAGQQVAVVSSGAIALGARRNTPTGLGGHPFDLEWGLLHPGECPCPFHSHSAQWELFIFLSGTAAVRTANGWSEVQPGDCVLHAPGQPHQFANRGNDDVEYLLIADNPLSEHWHYPDSGKWGLRAPRMFFRAQTADYWDGEE